MVWDKRPIGAAQAPDVLITNALIVDHWGIVKADIGIRMASLWRLARPAIRR